MVLTLIVVQVPVVYYSNTILVFLVFLNLPVFLLVHSPTSRLAISQEHAVKKTFKSIGHAKSKGTRLTTVSTIESEHPMSNGDVVLYFGT